MLNRIQGILANVYFPETYGQEMSYYETLRVLIDKVNECIDTVNGIEDRLVTYINNRLASYDEVYQARFRTIEANINNISNSIESITANISDISSNLDEAISNINRITSEVSAIQNNITVIQNDLRTLRSYVDSENTKTRETIALNVAQLNSRIDEVNALCTQLADEIKNAEARAKAYTDTEIEALDNRIRTDFAGIAYVYSPFTGKLVTIQTAINELASAGINSYTVSAYDVLMVSASAYGAKNISAYQFDFNSKAVLP